MGKLIVIEGLDGSGKSTQLELLPKALKKKGIDCKSVSFPDYESNSSALVKMYLGGEFGTKPEEVNAVASSIFYTVDRFASFKKNWGEYYNDGGIIVSGRYTTSNAVHQTSKLNKDKWKDFLDWLYDFEYNKIDLCTKLQQKKEKRQRIVVKICRSSALFLLDHVMMKCWKQRQSEKRCQ